MDVQLEMRHLKLLAAVAEEGSITRAGQKLHLTQSALSHQLRDAEEKLGASLFLRLGRKMALTPAGEHLLQSAKRVLAELKSAEEQIEKLNGGARGTIRLSTECYTCYHWLPPVLKEFQRKYPQVEVSIAIDATNSPVDALLEGRLDLGIISCICGDKSKNLRLTPTREDEVVIIMQPEHCLRERRYIKPQDLADETVLIYPPREDSTLLQKLLVPAGVEPKSVLEIPLTEGIVEMVAAGMGVSFLARWAVTQPLEARRIVARPFGPRGFRRRWYAATLRSQTVPYVTEFVKVMNSHSANHAPP
jgi:LysR family transcriptional regulator, regulator for metE and metH